MNEYGWSSSWSPITYIIAADPPSTPLAPSLVSATDTSITLALTLPTDNGGRVLSAFELFRDDGTGAANPTYSAVSSFSSTSFALSHSVSIAVDSLTQGRIYKFVTRASNAKGDSAYSNVLQAAVSSPPATPSAPYVDRSHSNETSVFMRFVANAPVAGMSPGSDITGY
jgi:hypothetical protein